MTLLYVPAASQRAFNLHRRPFVLIFIIWFTSRISRTHTHTLCLSPLSSSLVSDCVLFLQRRDQVRRTLESVRIFFHSTPPDNLDAFTRRILIFLVSLERDSLRTACVYSSDAKHNCELRLIKINITFDDSRDKNQSQVALNSLLFLGRFFS